MADVYMASPLHVPSRKLAPQISEEKIPNSKRRRTRLAKHAAAMAIHNHKEIQHHANRVLRDAADRQSGDRILVPEPPTATPDVSAGSEELPDTCVADRFFCSTCHKLADVCECIQTVLRTSFCHACDYQLAHHGLTLEDACAKAILDPNSHDEDQEFGKPCPICKNMLQLKLNFLPDYQDVCGECFGVNAQEDIVPCQSVECQGSDEALFHAGCMVKVLNEVRQCRSCHAVGVTLEGDDSDDSGSLEEEEEEDDEDSEMKQVQSHGLLRVGMAYQKGKILEIYPRINKVTLEVSAGGVIDIQHLRFDKVEEKIRQDQLLEAASSNLDSMD